MFHEEDHCFQCQELCHIAHHCPNVHCFECDEYGQIVADCPHRIPPSGTPVHHHRPNSMPGTALDQLPTTITRTGTDTADQGHSPIPADITVTVTTVPTDNILGCIIETTDTTIEILHDALTLVVIIHAMIPHTIDCLHTRTHQLILGTAADDICIQHTNQVRQPCINLVPIPAELQAMCMTKEIQKS